MLATRAKAIRPTAGDTLHELIVRLVLQVSLSSRHDGRANLGLSSPFVFAQRCDQGIAWWDFVCVVFLQVISKSSTANWYDGEDVLSRDAKYTSW